MATFTSFNDRLPDPTFSVTDTGTVGAGSSGPGFASTAVTSNRPVQVSRTNSGRGIHRESSAHFWEINISYHPMLREDFDTVNSFLDSRNGRLKPFYVVLPQYSKPKNAAFATFSLANVIKTQGIHTAGSSAIMLSAAIPITAYPRPGDFFTISDPSDINHQKTYKVTRVETNALYQLGSTQPSTSQVRVHIMPPLTKVTSSLSVINWHNPKFRVIQKNDVIETQLSTDNLYSFQLSLEEILP